jgi:hypothetical protein
VALKNKVKVKVTEWSVEVGKKRSDEQNMSSFENNKNKFTFTESTGELVISHDQRLIEIDKHTQLNYVSIKHTVQ